jgi:hypothetical protein
VTRQRNCASFTEATDEVPQAATGCSCSDRVQFLGQYITICGCWRWGRQQDMDQKIRYP